MKKELKEHIKKENKYIDLLENSPNYRLQGYSINSKKVVIGIIQGNPKEYNQIKDMLNYRYFDTGEDAYYQLFNN